MAGGEMLVQKIPKTTILARAVGDVRSGSEERVRKAGRVRNPEPRRILGVDGIERGARGVRGREKPVFLGEVHQRLVGERAPEQV